jgi:uncharacterized protein GlcG (DUF336 family)
MAFAGGVPIKIGDRLIGGLGVGGAHAPEVDEACAYEALAAVKK